MAANLAPGVVPSGRTMARGIRPPNRGGRLIVVVVIRGPIVPVGATAAGVS